MTIRKQWLIALLFIAILSVAINAFVLSSLIDKYFVSHMEDSYNKHFNQIIDYSKKALVAEDFSLKQMAIELESHLTDPIIRIKLYNIKGQLLVDVGSNDFFDNMGHGMMRRMKDFQFEEVDHADLYDNGIMVGQLNITRYSSLENSIATRMFKSSLLRNSFLSVGIVILFSVIIGMLVSKRMSKDLIQTANLAQSIEFGELVEIKHSKVKEIKIIQQSLDALKSKLKLKQKSRKRLIDEMVHQTRTPLTILKTHLEGYEDGIIDMSVDQIKICEDQIDNITSIISNISELIDTEQELVEVKIATFDFSVLLNQIIRGLKVQFDKKNIVLKITSIKEVVMKTDKYKLSQAIYNILTNAYKYTKPNGQVTVDYTVYNNRLKIIIEDNGIGIHDKDQNKVFNAYYRGSNTGVVASEGLGLYIANENIKSINGTIKVKSVLGEGSQFIIEIPLVI